MRCNELPLGLFGNKLEKKRSNNVGASKRIPCDRVLNSSDDEDVEDIVIRIRPPRKVFTSEVGGNPVIDKPAIKRTLI